MIKAPGNFLPSRGGGEAGQSQNSPLLATCPFPPCPGRVSSTNLLPTPPGRPSSSSLGDLGPDPKSSLCKVLPQDICAADSFCQLVTKPQTFHSSVIIFLALFHLASCYELCTVLLVLKKDPLSNLHGRGFMSDSDPPSISCNDRECPGLRGA